VYSILTVCPESSGQTVSPIKDQEVQKHLVGLLALYYRIDKLS
jgi:hypothetical protein